MGRPKCIKYNSNIHSLDQLVFINTPNKTTLNVVGHNCATKLGNKSSMILIDQEDVVVDLKLAS